MTELLMLEMSLSSLFAIAIGVLGGLLIPWAVGRWMRRRKVKGIMEEGSRDRQRRAVAIKRDIDGMVGEFITRDTTAERRKEKGL